MENAFSTRLGWLAFHIAALLMSAFMLLQGVLVTFAHRQHVRFWNWITRAALFSDRQFENRRYRIESRLAGIALIVFSLFVLVHVTSSLLAGYHPELDGPVAPQPIRENGGQSSAWTALVFGTLATAVGGLFALKPQRAVSLLRWNRWYSETLLNDPRFYAALRVGGAGMALTGLLGVWKWIRWTGVI